MKIAIISPGGLPLPPVKGGAVETLIDSFLLHNEVLLRHEIIVYTCDSIEAKEKAKQYKASKFRYIQMKSYRDRLEKALRFMINKHKYIGNLYITKVIKEIKKEKYDVIIVENQPSFILPLRKKINNKIVLHLHNDYNLTEEIITSYDGIFTVSNYIKDQVLSVKKTPKVKTLYNGIDTKAFNKKKYELEFGEMRTKYGISMEDTVVLYSGRINAEKGVKELIEAFKMLPNKENVKLLIVGSAIYGENITDPFLIELKEEIQDLQDNIIFTGYINYSEMPKIYAIADIGVIPSIGVDAAPLTVVESMATGIPVITSDSGGIPEFVEKEYGAVIQRGEQFKKELMLHLEALIKDKEKRLEMGKLARKAATNLDVGKYGEKMNNLIEQVLGK